MNKTYRYIIAFLISVIATVGFYFGSYLSLRKSQLYIAGYSNVGHAQSLQDFNGLMNPALDFYSPIGRDEVVESYLGVIINIISRNPPPPNPVVDALVRQSEARMMPILEAGKGFNFSQNLYNLGMIYKIGAIRLRSTEYYEKSIEVFEEGLDRSPNRPVFLYNLFDLYLGGGRNDKARAIGESILKYWPGDSNVRKIVESLK